MGSYSVKIVSYYDGKRPLSEDDLNESIIEVPPGTDNDKRREFLSSIIAGYVRTNEIKGFPAACNLSGAFTRIYDIAPVKAGGLKGVSGGIAGKNLPFPAEEAVWDYSPVAASREGCTSVQISAVRKPLAAESSAVLKDSGLVPLILAPTVLALENLYGTIAGGALSGKWILGCHLGHSKTEVFLLRDGRVYCSKTIAIAGEALDKTLAEAFKTDENTARCYKEKYGVLVTREQKIAAASRFNSEEIKTSFVCESILKKLSAIIKMFLNENQAAAPEKVFLSGGLAHMPNIASFFEKDLGAHCEIPSEKLIDAKDRKILPFAPSFAVAAGLALRNRGDWLK